MSARFVVLAGNDQVPWFIHMQTNDYREAQSAMGQPGLRLIDTQQASVLVNGANV